MKAAILILALLMTPFALSDTAEAEFCAVTVVHDEFCVVTPEAASYSVPAGSEFELQITSAEGYSVSSILVNGEERLSLLDADGYFTAVIDADTRIEIYHVRESSPFVLIIAAVALLAFAVVSAVSAKRSRKPD
ncbi:MAG: hypothetical protein Q4B99_05365 [Clostridia bacterium]|nr:hypothetical protein [Clostridia bacterium]